MVPAFLYFPSIMIDMKRSHGWIIRSWWYALMVVGIGCGGPSGPQETPALPAQSHPVTTVADHAPPTPDTLGATAAFPAASAHAGATLTHAIIEAPNGTFGYDVFSDGKLFLHQTNLPGQPGVEGCKTREDVEKLAAFVITKIKKGEMPPTVTTEELKTLGIVH
ncbi:MAG: DUF4907 domain-containing protein [Rhodoferax sp.]|nr:DUF4907 domain-containing protein [Rhodoferax sp.]